MTIQKFFENNPRTALAFSGGVDSAFLLYAGITYGQDITAYYVKSEFQPQFELEDAKRLADELGAKLKVIDLSVLADPNVKCNGPRRCYYCKRMIFNLITEQAQQDGYSLLIDGTNASDDVDDRPGMQALKELMDDMTGEKTGFAMERLFEADALDVYTLPIGMKKNRPGILLRVMCRESDKEAMIRAIFKHTTTIGIREQKMQRYILQREIEAIETPLGTIRKKAHTDTE